MVIVIPEELETRIRGIAHAILRAPFTKQTWSELFFFMVGVPSDRPSSDPGCAPVPRLLILCQDI
jgi:hypothetical protein